MRRTNYIEAISQNSKNHEFAVLQFIADREHRWDEVRNKSSWVKQVYKERHDLVIRKELSFENGSL
ncbi:hypothetical protein EPUL_006526, partial [Erysiphe pulchra]